MKTIIITHSDSNKLSTVLGKIASKDLNQDDDHELLLRVIDLKLLLKKFNKEYLELFEEIAYTFGYTVGSDGSVGFPPNLKMDELNKFSSSVKAIDKREQEVQTDMIKILTKSRLVEISKQNGLTVDDISIIREFMVIE
ncbi:MAG TPA: hypothetical protein VGE26_09875 [Sphingobacteriaceae bacterium]